MPIELPSSNLIDLAARGFRFLRRINRGPNKDSYLPLPGKSGSTHKLHSTRPKPRYDPKNAPRGMVRVIYGSDNPAGAVDFPNTADGREAAAEKLKLWLELAHNAAPTSAVAVPRGRSYKHFVQARTEAAKNGSLYDKNKTKPKPPSRAQSNMAKTTETKKDQKNGMTRPKEGTTCRKVWDIADKHDGERAAVLKECAGRKINDATAMTQFGKWRAYHGLVGKKAAKRKPAPPAKKKPTPPKRKPAPPKAPAAAPAAAE